MSVAKPRFLLFVHIRTRTTRGTFLSSDGIGNTYKEASAFSHAVYNSKQTQPTKSSVFPFVPCFRSRACIFGLCLKIRELFISSCSSGTFQSLNLAVITASIQWQHVFAPRYPGHRNFLSRRRFARESSILSPKKATRED